MSMTSRMRRAMAGRHPAIGASPLADQAVGEGHEQIGCHARIACRGVTVASVLEAEATEHVGEVDMPGGKADGRCEAGRVEAWRFVPRLASACRLAAEDGQVEANEMADHDGAREAGGNRRQGLGERWRTGELRTVDAVDRGGARRDLDARVDQEIEC